MNCCIFLSIALCFALIQSSFHVQIKFLNLLIICCANQLTGFYMRATLAFSGLKGPFYQILLINLILPDIMCDFAMSWFFLQEAWWKKQWCFSFLKATWLGGISVTILGVIHFLRKIASAFWSIENMVVDLKFSTVIWYKWS